MQTSCVLMKDRNASLLFLQLYNLYLFQKYCMRTSFLMAALLLVQSMKRSHSLIRFVVPLESRARLVASDLITRSFPSGSNNRQFQTQPFASLAGDKIELPKGPKKSTNSGEGKKVPQTAEEHFQVRVNKIRDLKSQGKNPFAYNFHANRTAIQLHAEFAQLAPGTEDTAAVVSVAGRIMLRRVFGKLAFFTLQDQTGTIQMYLDKASLGDEFEAVKDLTDAGDIAGFKGHMKRTDKGELSVYVTEWTMLTKSLRPLPDKFHGITDTNLRYRHRHLDMIVHPEVRKTLRSRAFIVKNIRHILDCQGFLEVDTPVLQLQPGGADAKPFVTHHNALDQSLTLRIATELHLKRMVVGGFDRVFELGRIFRNEGLSTRHNPEFTTVELYQAYADYGDMMDLCERIVCETAMALNGNLQVQHGQEVVDLSGPWRKVSMAQLVLDTTGIDMMPFIVSEDVVGARAVTSQFSSLQATISVLETAGEVLNVLFEEFCEPSLIQPTFVTDHPASISPLAKPHRSSPGLTERFELFVNGRELANAFSELTDPIDQRERFNKQVVGKVDHTGNTATVDEDFLTALESGMPPTAGMGIGVDRLVMLLTNSTTIKDVIPFPLQRKEK